MHPCIFVNRVSELDAWYYYNKCSKSRWHCVLPSLHVFFLANNHHRGLAARVVRVQPTPPLPADLVNPCLYRLGPLVGSGHPPGGKSYPFTAHPGTAKLGVVFNLRHAAWFLPGLPID